MRADTILPDLLVLTLAWGVLPFGAVLPWAYWPLLAMCTVLAVVAAVATRGRARGPWPRALALGLSVVAAAVVLQLLLPYGGQTLPVSVRPFGGPASAEGALLFWAPERLPDVVSINPAATLRGLAFLVALSVFLLGTERLFSTVGVRRFIGRFMVLAVVVALISLVQQPLFGQILYGLLDADRPLPSAPFVNRNHTAGWLLMALGLGLGYFAAGATSAMAGVKPEWRARVLWFASPEANRLLLTTVALSVMGVALVSTLSRSGILCFTIACALCAVSVIRGRGARGRRLLASSYAVLLVVAVVAWVGLDAIAQRFARLTMDVGRPEIWADTSDIIRDFPIVGTGLNTYDTATRYYQTALLDHTMDEAHNDYLQLASEGGVLLGLPILLAIALLIREIRRRWVEDGGGQTHWIRVGAVIGLIAIAFQEVVEFSLQLPGNAVLWATLAAIAIHRPARRFESRSRETGPELTRHGLGAR